MSSFSMIFDSIKHVLHTERNEYEVQLNHLQYEVQLNHLQAFFFLCFFFVVCLFSFVEYTKLTSVYAASDTVNTNNMTYQ